MASPEEERSRAARIARNELMFRSVNERIGELGEQWQETLDIVCECANPECFGRIELPRSELDRITDDRRRFFVLPGHEVADFERIVERHGGYAVVEKPADADKLARG